VIAEVDLGQGSAPHGVIVGADGAAWVTDSGRNEIQRVDGGSHEITRYPLPGRNVNLNTAAFDGGGRLWFTGQGGAYGSVDPASGEVDVFEAPRGRGPYGIAATPSGEVWFVSLAGNYLARIESGTGEAEIVDVPTAGQNARRVWSDSTGRLWVSEWDAGQLAMYDPAGGAWREWVLPGPGPRAYSVYVDELDLVWLTDFGSNSIVRFDPATETFLSFPIPSADASVRQMLGRPGEVWGAESGTDKLIASRRHARRSRECAWPLPPVRLERRDSCPAVELARLLACACRRRCAPPPGRPRRRAPAGRWSSSRRTASRC
jgi:virginiamycin B lyase